MRVPVSPHLHLLLYVFFTLTALLGTSEDEMDGINNLMDMSLSKLWEMVKDREAWSAAVHQLTESQTWLSDWTTTLYEVISHYSFDLRFLSTLDCKEIQPVPPKRDQSWVFIGRTEAKAETPILWPPDAKSWVIGKDSDAGRDWGQEEKGTTEDEMAGWHHWLDGHEFE